MLKSRYNRLAKTKQKKQKNMEYKWLWSKQRSEGNTLHLVGLGRSPYSSNSFTEGFYREAIN